MTHTDKHQGKWFKEVDSLRFVLAFIVVLSHYDNVPAEWLKASTNIPVRLLGMLLANAYDGTAAVIAFFIISGFVIHYPCKGGIDNLGRFWMRRSIRITIPLAVILLAGVPFGGPEKAVTWSLYCELIYYTIYPALAAISISWQTKFAWSFALALAFILIFGWHDVNAFIYQTNSGYHGYYWQFGPALTWLIGLPCWILGVLLAENIDRPHKITFKQVSFYRLIALTLSCILSVAKFHFHLSYLLSMNFMALFLYLWLRAEIVYYKTQRPYATLEKLGKFSYSLYLCHPLCLVIFKRLLILNTPTYLVYLSATVLIAYLFYLLVERPSHRLARSVDRRLFQIKA